MIEHQSEDPPNPASDSSASAFRRLHPLGRVGVRSAACLHLQKPFVGCHRCEECCPHASLTLEEGRLALDPTRCTGCGLCAASCPTDALVVDGCTLTASAAGAAVTLACERLGTTPVEANCRLTCLAALTVGDYLRLALAADGAPIRVVIDETGCQRCPVLGGHENPSLAVIQAARRTLVSAGLPDEALPHPVAPPPLPNGNYPAGELSGRPALGRRAFFAGLSRAFSAGVSQAAGASLGSGPTRPTLSPRPREPVPKTRGIEARLLLLALARRHGHAGPATAELARVTVDDTCRAHGACARACPGGALTLERDETRATLAFDPWQCLDCGACERICPEEALRHTPAAWREAPAQAQTLATVAQAECVRCGAPVAADESTLCDRCTKSGRLARTGFALFHPAHRESAESP